SGDPLPVAPAYSAAARNSVFSSRFGLPFVSPTTSGTALPVSASATSEGAASGLASRYSAATPATCGLAMDVPEMVFSASSPSIQAEVISSPGARMSTHSPQFDHGVAESAESVAP